MILFGCSFSSGGSYQSWEVLETERESSAALRELNEARGMKEGERARGRRSLRVSLFCLLAPLEVQFGSPRGGIEMFKSSKKVQFSH